MASMLCLPFGLADQPVLESISRASALRCLCSSVVFVFLCFCLVFLKSF